MIRVWRIPFSTNVERVALAAGHKGIEVAWLDVEPADRSSVVAVSGQPLVPVLEADGEVVHDSPVVLEWLEARFPEPPLLPADPARSEEARVFADWFNRVWKIAPNAIDAELDAGEPDRGRIAAWAAELRGSLDRFEALLDGRDFLLGERFGLADCTAFPFLKYATIPVDPADGERFHAILAEHLALAGRHPRVAGWIERVDALPRA